MASSMTRLQFSEAQDMYEQETAKMATTVSKDADGDWWYTYTIQYVQWLESKVAPKKYAEDN